MARYLLDGATIIMWQCEAADYYSLARTYFEEHKYVLAIICQKKAAGYSELGRRYMEMAIE